MESKVASKWDLIRANEAAFKAKANSVVPEVLEALNERFWYIVTPALPFPERHGFVRCFVFLCNEKTPTDGNYEQVIIDFSDYLFDSLTDANVKLQEAEKKAKRKKARSM